MKVNIKKGIGLVGAAIAAAAGVFLAEKAGEATESAGGVTLEPIDQQPKEDPKTEDTGESKTESEETE